ncbi:MAG: hypothetical protein IT214_03680 [Chitinophagaceae bacterium]|jgi:hypothetical protein|nr:hypothetical protein [Chitinophagaceae bacterium]OQY95755.1 MAG: hypothetical protein B6D37_04680 [Sphingobacteriales bacterium UTBCD1]
MKKAILLLLPALLIISCNNKENIPDVSGIKVNLRFQRFDKEFFAIDSNNVLPGMDQLNIKYPVLNKIFLQNILGLDSASMLPGVKRYLSFNRPIYDSAAAVFKNTDALEKDFNKAFQFVKYYFPDYKVPGIVTIVGPLDALAKLGNELTPDFLGPDFLGISLQFYLGKKFSLYNDPFFIDNIAPRFRSRRFSKEYIVPDAMKLIVDDLFQDKSAGKSLIDQMIEKGKQWWLLDKFLPETPDSLKTGYTQQQLDWCNQNEGMIWSTIVGSGDLNSINPVTIQAYIGEGPFTQGFSQEYSPGNLGQWIGRQIIRKFVEKNPGMKIADVMSADPLKIIETAKYKPK